MEVYCPDPVQGQQLAVVTHAGDPSVHTKSQNLHVAALKLPSCELERNVARSSLPLRALAYSPDGNLLAVGGDAENVRLHNVAEGMR
ncbi:hypothetical protein HaLaN_14800 [Haematococcus lacustris]|uniref:Anaphase-promoting complex subunit 4 WD40 domain-containing protein n=1 Tax=Haematococcus lacustris TaxID=44745 RepID=A0A699ZQ83_HAELA|nr:hypothetical protein HaLaN_14800 [Haematococcus lacustris]